MKGLRCWWWMGCMGVALFGAPAAHADGGRISFTGAVVAPTCTVDAAGLSGFGAAPRQFTCGNAGRSPTSAPRAYAITQRTPIADVRGDRLLAYFGQYVAAADKDAQPSLVTQTYD